MRPLPSVLIAALGCAALPALAAPAEAPRPAALKADGLPAIPADLVARVGRYLEFRSAAFLGWTPDGQMLVTTRFGNTAQLHRVAAPGAARTQLTFEAEPVVQAEVSPGAGDVTLVAKDQGGDEFFQLYRLTPAGLTLLSDGKSRNAFGSWSADGTLAAFSSTRRNGSDTDLYVMDPRNPASTRMVAPVKGGGWAIAAIAPDKRSGIVANYVSVTDTRLSVINLASGAMRPVGDHATPVAWRNLRYAPDGKVWAISDQGSDFARLGTVDLASGRFTAFAPEPKWDVESFEISRDGRTLAYVANTDGIGTLRLVDVATGTVRTPRLPAGTVSSLAWSPKGLLGFTLTSARSAADAWSLDPVTLAPTRWTMSEAAWDTAANVEPTLLTVRSFDGETVSGFLYRPDPQRFPGKRPLIVSIHGGPESQTRPGFLGRNNYLINELGYALFYPNVRGSTGYGKRFVSLDNGPFKREDSVKDIGALMTALKAHPAIDASRMGVTGGSYGGYMCYASAIRYGADFKGAQCTVAISNFNTFLENTQGYRRDLRRVEYGDERDPKQRAKLAEISPMTRAKELRIPLFVVTGANDPRVPQSEADQMVAAVRANGQPAWHLIGTNEGHGFAKKENQDYQTLATVVFWESVLGK